MALLFLIRALWRKYRALLPVCRALLPVCRALLTVCRALLPVCRALLAIFCGYDSYVGEPSSLLPHQVSGEFFLFFSKGKKNYLIPDIEEKTGEGST